VELYENVARQARENQKKGTQYNSDDEPKSQRRYWTDQEHERFLDAIQNFGHKNVKAISAYVGTRSATQVRTHAQKYFLKAARENKAREKATMIQGALIHDRSPVPDFSIVTFHKLIRLP
jgi:SHAQKYF class myb-like DNA-binding protein